MTQSARQSQGQNNQPNTSATEAVWQQRISAMDNTFYQSIDSITQCRTQVTALQNQASQQSGQPITFNQLEVVNQQLSRALADLYTARQSLPIGVTTS